MFVAVVIHRSRPLYSYYQLSVNVIHGVHPCRLDVTVLVTVTVNLNALHELYYANRGSVGMPPYGAGKLI